MTGIIAPNIPTNTDDAAAISAREAEHAAIGENATPFVDDPGDGSYIDPYLGMNRAGGSSPGVGVCTGLIYQTEAEVSADGPIFTGWTELDQGVFDGSGGQPTPLPRIPQDSGILGHSGSVIRVGNVETTWDKSQALYTENGAASSGGAEGAPDLPITMTEGADINDTANFVIANQAAIDGGIMDSVSGAINNTGGDVAQGDLVWGRVPV